MIEEDYHDKPLFDLTMIKRTSRHLFLYSFLYSCLLVSDSNLHTIVMYSKIPGNVGLVVRRVVSHRGHR